MKERKTKKESKMFNKDGSLRTDYRERIGLQKVVKC